MARNNPYCSDICGFCDHTVERIAHAVMSEMSLSLRNSAVIDPRRGRHRNAHIA